jgi:hypothetical protein
MQRGTIHQKDTFESNYCTVPFLDYSPLIPLCCVRGGGGVGCRMTDDTTIDIQNGSKTSADWKYILLELIYVELSQTAIIKFAAYIFVMCTTYSYLKEIQQIQFFSIFCNVYKNTSS